MDENHFLTAFYAKISTDDRELSEVDHLSIYTEKDVILQFNFDFNPKPRIFCKVFSRKKFSCLRYLNFILLIFFATGGGMTLGSKPARVVDRKYPNNV